MQFPYPSQLEIPITVTGTSCIYALIDPRTNEIRYIGKTNNPKERLLSHIRDTGSKTHKSRWVRKVISEGYCPSMVILERVSRDSWEEAEIRWIAHFRAAGARLTNSTDGGDAISEEFIFPPGERAKLRAAPMRNRKPDSSKRKITCEHVGVTKMRDDRWRAFYHPNGARVHIGYFNTLEEAIIARNRALQEGPVKNPNPQIKKLKDSRNKSGVSGVCRMKGLWMAYFNIDGKQVVLGHFDDLEQAVAARKSSESGNVVIAHRPKRETKPKQLREPIDPRLKYISKRNTSGVKGVSYMPSRNKWQAYFRPPKGKMKNLGKFRTFDEAVAARKASENEHYGEFARAA